MRHFAGGRFVSLYPLKEMVTNGFFSKVDFCAAGLGLGAADADSSGRNGGFI
jgi:hypothetical protein